MGVAEDADDFVLWDNLPVTRIKQNAGLVESVGSFAFPSLFFTVSGCCVVEVVWQCESEGVPPIPILFASFLLVSGRNNHGPWSLSFSEHP